VKQLVAGKTAQGERLGTDRVFNLAVNRARGNACAGGTAQVVALRLRAQWREASEAIRDRCAGGAAQAMTAAARPGFSLRLAVLMQARWGESRWLIRLVVLASMFGCPFVGCRFFLDLRAAGRGRMLCEAGDPRLL